jgi:hypothetical protein
MRIGVPEGSTWTGLSGKRATRTPRESGRIFGPTLERRLRTSIETILKSAEWNARTAVAIEQAWAEEQENPTGLHPCTPCGVSSALARTTAWKCQARARSVSRGRPTY